ncbi:MAG: hypothetical protein ACREP6_12090 [Candidatus Binataceae bacterium]
MKRSSASSRSRSGRSSDSRAHSAGRAKNSRPQRSSKSAKVNSDWLGKFLLEMRAVETGGVQLYEKALEELSDEKYRAQLEKFLDQTNRHLELCDEMMEAASIEDDHESPGAEAAQHKAQGLISAEVPEEMSDLNNFENLVLAETKDHWNWEMLNSVAEEIEDTNLKRAVKRAVREVLKQEVDHVERMKRAQTEMARLMAHKPAEEEEEIGEEEEESERL